MHETSIIVTTDHTEIKKWAQAYRARPALVGNAGEDEEIIGIRLDFPGQYDESMLREDQENPDVSWDRFFQIFEDKNLAFEYYLSSDNHDPTLLYKFVPRQNMNKVI